MFAAPPSNLRRAPSISPPAPLQRAPSIGSIGFRSPTMSLRPMMNDESETPFSEQLKKLSSSNGAPIVFPRRWVPSNPPDLRFDRPQPSDEEIECKHKRVFGRFVVREAIINEEYWIAAWLRTEAHWEGQPYTRLVESLKQKFLQQEFHALKRRCNKSYGDKCLCILALKKEEKNVKRTLLSSIVGTLDLSIRHLLSGEKFPGEHGKTPMFYSRKDAARYGYVTNLSVAKFARRQGIASNMLLLSSEAAKSYGADQMFVHVHKDNTAARGLYGKMGFQIVEMATASSSESDNHLLCLKI